jgi:hypothetical protein
MIEIARRQPKGKIQSRKDEESDEIEETVAKMQRTILKILELIKIEYNYISNS